MSCMLVLLVGIYIVYTYFETSRLSYDFETTIVLVTVSATGNICIINYFSAQIIMTTTYSTSYN